MSEDKMIRTPRQARSRQLKEKIKDTALNLFCEKGYYNVTTNEIAKMAGISIGSLYSYFKDKDTIFLEILEQYHERFQVVFNEIQSEMNAKVFEEDKKLWIRTLLERLIELHLSMKELNRELKSLYYVKPEVTSIMDKQEKKVIDSTLSYLMLHKDVIKVDDIESTAIIVVDFISSTVDRIVFGNTECDKDRILNTSVNAIYKFLM